jgi:hypothetical protein
VVGALGVDGAAVQPDLDELIVGAGLGRGLEVGWDGGDGLLVANWRSFYRECKIMLLAKYTDKPLEILGLGHSNRYES